MSPEHSLSRAVIELLEAPLRAIATTYRHSAVALLDDDGGIHPDMSRARLDLHLRRIGEVEDVEDALRACSRHSTPSLTSTDASTPFHPTTRAQSDRSLHVSPHSPTTTTSPSEQDRTPCDHAAAAA